MRGGKHPISQSVDKCPHPGRHVPAGRENGPYPNCQLFDVSEHDCERARYWDHTMSPQIKSLQRRSASKPRADQHLTEEREAERLPTDIYLPRKIHPDASHAGGSSRAYGDEASGEAPEMMQGIAIAITASATKGIVTLTSSGQHPGRWSSMRGLCCVADTRFLLPDVEGRGPE
jgi:hypothetical protein